MDSSPISVARQLGVLISDLNVRVLSADAFGLSAGKRAEAWCADTASVALIVETDGKTLTAIMDALTSAGAVDVKTIRGACRGIQLRFMFTDVTAAAITGIDLSSLRPDHRPDTCPVCSGPMRIGGRSCSRRCSGIIGARARGPNFKKARA